MTGAAQHASLAVVTSNDTVGGPFLLVCEHASSNFPDHHGTLGLDPVARNAHIAWDPGAFPLAQRLSALLDAQLISSGISRLVYDLNRAPNSPAAMPDRSEVFDIPGNVDLSAADRLARTEEVYIPFHSAVFAEISRRLSSGHPPVLVTIHSFTPLYFNRRREVELGVIHDADPTFAEAVLDKARATSGLICRMNDPYSAADGVTHTLRLHATPYGLHNVMLEIRNDLLADDTAVGAMAEKLASILQGALAEMQASGRREAV